MIVVCSCYVRAIMLCLYYYCVIMVVMRHARVIVCVVRVIMLSLLYYCVMVVVMFFVPWYYSCYIRDIMLLLCYHCVIMVVMCYFRVFIVL